MKPAKQKDPLPEPTGRQFQKFLLGPCEQPANPMLLQMRQWVGQQQAANAYVGKVEPACKLFFEAPLTGHQPSQWCLVLHLNWRDWHNGIHSTQQFFPRHVTHNLACETLCNHRSERQIVQCRSLCKQTILHQSSYNEVGCISPSSRLVPNFLKYTCVRTLEYLAPHCIISLTELIQDPYQPSYLRSFF